MKKPVVEFKRLVVLSNPRSSNAKRAKKTIAALEKAYPDKIVIGTIANTETTNVSLLKETLRPGDILIICGGDGTISSLIQCLLNPSIPRAMRSTPVLLVGTGRMNDLARILHGKRTDDALYALKNGKLMTTYPLKCVCKPLESDGQPLVKTAIYSLGFGYSGEGSVVLNDPAFRAQRQVRTSVTRPVKFFKDGWDMLNNARYFDITLHGKRRAVLDVSAANGQILYGYWRVPTKLSKREFGFTMLDDKSFLNKARVISDAVTKRFSSGKIVTSIRFTLHDQVTGHVGGESFTPPAPCEVRITHHKEPVIMLATNPKV